MPHLSSRVARVLICTIFNLLFEYSLRGVGGFGHNPVLVPVLCGVYVAYFSMLDDLIQRWRLHNYELLLIAFCYALLIGVFAAGTIVDKRGPLGLNPGGLLLEGVLWWGILQSLLTFYLAGRLVRRDWSAPAMGLIGWVLALVYTALFLALTARNPLLRHGSATSYATIAALGLAAILGLAFSLRRPRPAPWDFRASRLLDALVAISALLFVVVGSLPVHKLAIGAAAYVNPTAVPIVIVWSFIYSAGYLIYRWQGGHEVTI